MKTPILLLGAVAAAAASAPALDTVVNIPPAISIAGIQSNTQVNVLDGADLGTLSVPVGLSNVQLNVQAGAVGFIRQAPLVKLAGGRVESIASNPVGARLEVVGGEVRRVMTNNPMHVLLDGVTVGPRSEFQVGGFSAPHPGYLLATSRATGQLPVYDDRDLTRRPQYVMIGMVF